MESFSFVTVCMLIIEFFLFACLGWMMEVTLKYIQFHRFINRGFLIGPYCPIYGMGVVAVTVLVGGLIGRNGTIGETFLAGFVICGALEYFTSWYMEKLFHARWWDYSQKPMNLNGRIWIGNLILFGIGSVVIIRWIDPAVFSALKRWPVQAVEIVAAVITAIIVADEIVSHILMNIVKKEIDSQDADNTEEVSKKVHELLKNRPLLLRRIHEAYPNLQARPASLVNEMKAAKKELKQAARHTKDEMRLAASATKGKLEEKVQQNEKNWSNRVQEAKRLQKEAALKLHNVEKRFSVHREEWKDE